MRKETREQFPEWSNFNDGVKYNLVLSNDLDSLISCVIMQQKYEFNIGYFYDFKTLYATQTQNVNNFLGLNNEKLYIDVATVKEKSIDNHVQAICGSDTHNENSVNLNNVGRFSGCNDYYFSKYCGSTLLTVMSMLNIEIPEDEDLQMILLAIDSTYLGFYGNRQYRESNRKHLRDMLGFEQLYDLQSRKTPEDFKAIIEKYNLKTGIKMVNDKLTYTQDVSLLQEKLLKFLNINIILSDEILIPIDEYKTDFFEIPNKVNPTILTKDYQLEMGLDINSLAMTGQRKVSYSYKRIVA